MKFNRILSMLLAVIMLSTALMAANPAFTVSAANSASSTDFNIQSNIYIKDGKKETFTATSSFKENFKDIKSASELLQKELSAGQLMYTSSENGMYTIYVNVYTGYMYYKNNLTGQILMSNYYNYNNTSTSNAELFSQIYLEYYDVTNTSTSKPMTSFSDAAAYDQIYVTKISNGLRVNYTLGDTTLRYLVPGRISEDRYMDCIIMPILDEYLNAVDSLIKSKNSLAKKYYSTDQNQATRFFKKSLGKNTEFKKLYLIAGMVMGKDTNGPEMSTEYIKSGANEDFNSVIKSLEQMVNLDTKVYYCPEHKAGSDDGSNTCRRCGKELEEHTVAEYLFYDFGGSLNMNVLSQYIGMFTTMFSGSNMFGSLDNPLQEDLYAPLMSLVGAYRNASDGAYVYCNLTPGDDDTTYANLQKLINKYCVYVDNPTYSFNDMYKDEKTWGYVHAFKGKPVFRCALEYTFNSDGSLCVTLPANSISFDESSYILGTITPLKYFGSGLLTAVDYNDEKSGYIFYPDGSGTIIAFKDFNSKVNNHAPIYGIDHAYSDIYNIVGDYREQITMPVYGIVYTENTDEQTKAVTGTNTLNNGFFAVIEEGAALATLYAELDNNKKLAISYATYQPYPSDEYDLSKTISVSGLDEYKMVSESKYNGSYKTRYTMLSDEKLTSAFASNNYTASYVGMAQCYREYLINNGSINAIAEIGNDLPLYVEAFGSMEVTKKIMSFPVEVSMELTTFDNIRTMYDEFSSAKEVLHNKALEYKAKADAEEKDLELKSMYLQKASEYLALESKIQNITNVNFRLTGFANGGMEYTYPSKVKWDKVVGGKEGFESLLRYSDEVYASNSGANLGIYPEFDFLYITNTSMFDGISANKISSKLIDNRYATKQLYNSVTHTYEGLVTSVVSADALAELYTKFNKDFSSFNVKSISVSTLGSDVNSNFDDENSINRDEATSYISDVLSAMRSDGYDIMVNKGNAYSVKYASHIIDAYIDSSHLLDSSYTVPFFGMVLHGYVSYTGNALNYSGDPDYDILRSIESGASIYYILCYQNTEKMKEDENLNKYYGVSYVNWFEKIVEHYATINSAIGGLQSYEIVDHRILKVERVITDTERPKAYTLLVQEFVDNVRAQVENRFDEEFGKLMENGQFGKGVQVDIDVDALLDAAVDMLRLENNIQISDEFSAEVKDSVRAYLEALEKEFNEELYPAPSENPAVFTFDGIESYDSNYNYITDSYSTDTKYDETDYTVDNYNVVMVTYRNSKTGDEAVFVLNYNVYDIIVNIDGVESFILPKYGFKAIK